VLELVGTNTLVDSLNCCRPGGTVCMTGILGNSWSFDQFRPLEQIPHTVRLTIYTGGPADLDARAYNEFLRDIADGLIDPCIDRVFAFEDVVAAHEYMESNQAKGKLVVTVRPD
jgi:NADPH:quinone reductase